MGKKGGFSKARTPVAKEESPAELTIPAGAVCIDGSLLEGGGQILRNAVALSAITGKPIHVNRIRAGRAKPGLSPQHLTGLKLVESICSGHLEGGEIRSTSINFTPGTAAVGSYVGDTKTAGSCTLMVQQALPVLLYAPPPTSVSTLTLKGGTDASFAPPIGYLQDAFLPTVKRLMGPAAAGVDLKLVRRGFYPKGGGEAVLQVPSLAAGQTLPAFDITHRGHLVRIDGYAYTAGRVRPDVAQRMAQSATNDLRKALKDSSIIFGSSSSSSSAAAAAADAPAGSAGTADPICSVVVDIQAVQEPPERSFGDGGGIVLVAQTSTGCLFGSTALAERGVTAEAVGAIAAKDLIEAMETGAAVDDWMQDQLIVFMALAGGTSRMLCNELTLHTRTAISIMEQLLPGVEFVIAIVHGDQHSARQLYMVQCKGVGASR